MELPALVGLEIQSGATGCFVEQQRIGPTSDRNALESIRWTKQVLERAIEGSLPSSSGQKQGTIDIKEEDLSVACG